MGAALDRPANDGRRPYTPAETQDRAIAVLNAALHQPAPARWPPTRPASHA
jgi:hypothetical protein